jgi:putative oxidoreductase
MDPVFPQLLRFGERAPAVPTAVALGVFTQVAALVLMLVMLGAIQKKIFVWHIGFWGREYVRVALRSDVPDRQLVILRTGSGRLVLLEPLRYHR